MTDHRFAAPLWMGFEHYKFICNEVDVWQQEWIFRACVIEVCEINADPPFSFFVLATKIFASHSRYWTSLMESLARSFSTSSLMILFLSGANLFHFCLTCFAPSFTFSQWVMMIEPIPVISWCDQASLGRYWGRLPILFSLALLKMPQLGLFSSARHQVALHLFCLQPDFGVSLSVAMIVNLSNFSPAESWRSIPWMSFAPSLSVWHPKGLRTWWVDSRWREMPSFCVSTTSRVLHCRLNLILPLRMWCGGWFLPQILVTQFRRWWRWIFHGIR